MRWRELAKEFRELCLEAGGFGKSNSGSLSVIYDNMGEVSVEFGSYDIPTFSRLFVVGPYAEEEGAYHGARRAMKMMRDDVKKHSQEP